MPEAAIPSATPVRISPLASPRRSGGTWAMTADGARTISIPPVTPASIRQAKNHGNGSLVQHAASDRADSSMAPRTTLRTGSRAATGRAANAPPR